ncbi:MAG: histidinol-phosphate transaminase [Endomicrobia bacterium]|nr:histidinol-phosphate transaminase [Endomicrobiia bacterium]
MKPPKPRKEIKNFQPYIPGRPIDEIKQKYVLKTVYKLASNENPLGCPHKVVRESMLKLIRILHRYPEGSSLILRQKIAKKFGITPDEVIIGAGTDELIELVAKTYLNNDENIVVSDHAFIRYRMAGELMGAKIISVPMKNYKHDLDVMARKANKKTKIVFIANPNNPTGTYNTNQELKKFFDTLLMRKLYPLVVVDEAYYEYARCYDDYPESLFLRKLYPNLIILRTFSKIYGLAGLRVGFGIARKEVISDLDRVRPPFNVSVVAQYAATAVLDSDSHLQKSVALVNKEKQYLYSQLERIGLKYIPSATNFILIDVTPFKGEWVFRKLLSKGVIVRAMDEYEFPYFIRVTVGSHKENVAFITTIKQIIKKGDKNDTCDKK